MKQKFISIIKWLKSYLIKENIIGRGKYHAIMIKRLIKMFPVYKADDREAFGLRVLV